MKKRCVCIVFLKCIYIWTAFTGAAGVAAAVDEPELPPFLLITKNASNAINAKATAMEIIMAKFFLGAGGWVSGSSISRSIWDSNGSEPVFMVSVVAEIFSIACGGGVTVS